MPTEAERMKKNTVLSNKGLKEIMKRVINPKAKENSLW